MHLQADVRSHQQSRWRNQASTGKCLLANRTWLVHQPLAPGCGMLSGTTFYLQLGVQLLALHSASAWTLNYGHRLHGLLYLLGACAFETGAILQLGTAHLPMPVAHSSCNHSQCELVQLGVILNNRAVQMLRVTPHNGETHAISDFLFCSCCLSVAYCQYSSSIKCHHRHHKNTTSTHHRSTNVLYLQEILPW